MSDLTIVDNSTTKSIHSKRFTHCSSQPTVNYDDDLTKLSKQQLISLIRNNSSIHKSPLLNDENKLSTHFDELVVKMDSLLQKITILESLLQWRTTIDDHITNLNNKLANLEQVISERKNEASQSFINTHLPNTSTLNQLNSGSQTNNNDNNDHIHQGNNYKRTSVTENANYKVCISGIPESKKANYNDKMSDDKLQVEEILAHLKLNNLNIKDLRRTGYSSDSRPRILIVEFLTVWDARLVISKASAIKNYTVKNVFINRQLNDKERAIEKSILKYRYHLINSQGIPKSNLKIRHLKLFNNGIEVKIPQL